MNISDLNHVETVASEEIQGAGYKYSYKYYIPYGAYASAEAGADAFGVYFANTYTKTYTNTLSLPGAKVSKSYSASGSAAI